MALPLSYNVRSVQARWTSAVVAVLGIAGTVAVFVAVLAMARGFRATLTSSGSPDNALVRRAGTNSEMEGAVMLDQVRALGDAAGVARDEGGPLLVPEVVVTATLPLRDGESDANVQVRGTSARALLVRPQVKLREGRLFRPGTQELVAGRNAALNYRGLDVGGTVSFGGRRFEVVGILDAGGSSFDSEVWCDAAVLDATYQRPVGVFQSVTVRLREPAAFEGFARALAADPRLTVQVQREVEYYEAQSRALTTLIVVLGTLVSLVMAVGAVLAALNTMYSAVAERTREIAVLRALGFGGGTVVVAFMVEALMVAAVGGVVGCLAVLPVNGMTAGTLNWQTLSHLAFAFRVTPELLGYGMEFALAMGVLGGLPPAIRAARSPVAVALRRL